MPAVEPCRVENVPCCVCGEQAGGREVATGFDFEYESTVDIFRMVSCSGCNLAYLNPRPAAEELPTIYPGNYYAYQYEQAVHPVSRWIKGWLEERKLGGWLKLVDRPHPRFLDVGCGNGRFLHALKRRGVPTDQLWGVEMSKDVVRQLIGEGFQIRTGRIERIADLPEHGFDLIIMLQVLEHVTDPNASIARLGKLLDNDGILVLETPNVDSLDRRLFTRRYWGGYHFPRHWNLFDVTTLSRLLHNNGLEVISVRYLPSTSFWIYSLRHWVKYAWNSPRCAAWLNPFRNVPLQAFFTAFDTARAATGAKTSNMQVIAKIR